VQSPPVTTRILLSDVYSILKPGSNWGQG